MAQNLTYVGTVRIRITQVDRCLPRPEVTVEQLLVARLEPLAAAALDVLYEGRVQLVQDGGQLGDVAVAQGLEHVHEALVLAG